MKNSEKREEQGKVRRKLECPIALHCTGRIEEGFNGKKPEMAIKMNKNIKNKKRRLEKTGWQYKIMGRREVWGILGK